ncbi:MAG TPA: undecaprenyl-diphosphate phosphatase [Tepidisphaeraceae bacterium]|nr:undecaprenyl-diphosphate phosphatase [Tepidisphaeraceae bacterium]
MREYLLALLFGVVEGVTEFLPISSTAHLRLLKPLFGIPLSDPYWKMFDVVIQLGAVLCLPVFFRGRLFQFARSFPRNPTTGERDLLNHPVTLVAVAFTLTVIPVLLLKKVVSQNLEAPAVIGAALLVGGAVMWAVDAVFDRPRTQDVTHMNVLQAAWVGLVQVLAAVFPGTSRSMATIAAGQTVGLSRAAALEFSFLVSIPTMAAACLKDLYDALKPGHDASGLTPASITTHQWITLAIGFVVSFFVAWVVVAWFMGWVRKRGFVPFAIYRIVLGLGVLIWVYRSTRA